MSCESSICCFCFAPKIFSRGGWGAACFFRRCRPRPSSSSAPVARDDLVQCVATARRSRFEVWPSGRVQRSRRISRSTSAVPHFNSSRPARFPPTSKAMPLAPTRAGTPKGKSRLLARPAIGAVWLTESHIFNYPLVCSEKTFTFPTSSGRGDPPIPRAIARGP